MALMTPETHPFALGETILASARFATARPKSAVLRDFHLLLFSHGSHMVVMSNCTTPQEFEFYNGGSNVCNDDFDEGIYGWSPEPPESA